MGIFDFSYIPFMQKKGEFSGVGLNQSGILKKDDSTLSIINDKGFKTLLVRMRFTLASQLSDFLLRVYKTTESGDYINDNHVFMNNGFMYSGYMTKEAFFVNGSSGTFERVFSVDVSDCYRVSFDNNASSGDASTVDIKWQLTNGLSQFEQRKGIQPIGHWKQNTYDNIKTYGNGAPVGGSNTEINLDIDPMFKYIFLAVNYANSSYQPKSTNAQLGVFWMVQDFRDNSVSYTANNNTSATDVIQVGNISNGQRCASDWLEVRGKRVRINVVLAEYPSAGDKIFITAYGVR